MTWLGALGGGGAPRLRATIDRTGVLQCWGAAWALDWWVGADDRWRRPRRELTTRSRLVDGAPVSETRARVPGGDLVQRAYGVGGATDAIVVELENESPAAAVVAFVVRGARVVRPSAAGLLVDDHRLVLPRPPARWALGSEGEDALFDVVEQGDAASGLLDAVDGARPIDLAVLYPISHRTRLRVALTPPASPVPGLAALPDAEAAARGWRTVLDRGTRVVLPDPVLQERVDAARAEVLLDPDPDATTTAALEDWGFDAEAERAWRGLSWRARRRAARRDQWRRSRVTGTQPAWPEGAGALLAQLRRDLVDDDAGVVLAPALPDAWRGAPVEVHGAPTRHGTVSYAIRWHGEHPALLWEVRDPAPGLRLRAPALDGRWSTSDEAGEALLGVARSAS